MKEYLVWWKNKEDKEITWITKEELKKIGYLVIGKHDQTNY